MTRGSLAALSPNEETTLRRVALGVTKAATLSKLDVARLKALALIEDKDGELVLTGGGRARYLALPRSIALDSAESPNDAVARLASFMTKARA
jgi:hypothetical protein